MSVRLMTLVWDRYPRGGAHLLAMLALADWANDSGGNCHPSLATIARKIRLSRCQTQRIVRDLIHDDWLAVVGNPDGGKPGTTRQYQINVERLGETDSTDATPTGSVDATGSAGDTGSMDALDGSHGRYETGSVDAIQSVIDPSRTTNGQMTRFDDFWKVYPKKVKKKPARDRWKAKKLDSMADRIIADVEARQKRDRRWLDGFVPDPTTYISQERWEDEFESGVRPPSGGNGRQQDSAPMRKELA